MWTTLRLCGTADRTILTRAGIEKGVASTKAFATQVVTLWLLSLFVGEAKGTMEASTRQREIAALLLYSACVKSE